MNLDEGEDDTTADVRPADETAVGAAVEMAVEKIETGTLVSLDGGTVLFPEPVRVMKYAGLWTPVGTNAGP